jgi:glycosyltransferase involved in cell wall biosynthesis
MRVLHILATRERRGAEIFASDLVKWLDGAGVEQQVAVVRSPNGLTVPFRAPVRVLSREQRTIPIARIDPAALRRLSTQLREWGPHVIQAHGGEALKYAVLASRRNGIAVYRRIGATPRRVAGPLRTFGYRELIRRTHHVVAVSEASKRETVARFQVEPARIVVIPNGVDSDRFARARRRDVVRRAMGILPSASVMISVGALTWEKDPIAHVDVGARVLSRLPDAVHLFVGDGPMRRSLEHRIRANPQGDRMHLLGARSDVPDLLSASDVLLLASETEGMPAVAIEAGMAGIPVAGFGVAGIPEVVINRATGLLVAPRHLDGLGDAAIELLSNVVIREELGERAAEHCRTHFDIRAVAPRYLELYETATRTR